MVIATLALVVCVVQFVEDLTNPPASESQQQQVIEQQKRELACIAKWTDAYTVRSNFLQRYAAPRNDAQARLDIAIVDGQSDATVSALRVQFTRAEVAYNAAIKANPLPPAPSFQCARQITQSRPVTPAPGRTPTPKPTPTPTATPSPTPSRTPGRGATTRRAPPGTGRPDPHASTPGTRHPTTRASRTSTPKPTLTATTTPTGVLGLLCSLLKPLCPTT